VRGKAKKVAKTVEMSHVSKKDHEDDDEQDTPPQPPPARRRPEEQHDNRSTIVPVNPEAPPVARGVVSSGKRAKSSDDGPTVFLKGARVRVRTSTQNHSQCAGKVHQFLVLYFWQSVTSYHHSFQCRRVKL
jgi:hypothetical protein